MRLTNSQEIKEFKCAINQCKGEVWLEDSAGNKFNLCSELSQYIALGELLQEKGETLELFCSNPEDEQHFMKFFNNNPNTLC